MPFQKPSSQSFEVIPSGRADFVVDSIDDTKTKFGAAMRWVLGVGRNGKRIGLVSVITSENLGVGSRGRELFEAFLNRQLEDDDEPEELIAQLVGRKASGQITQINKDGKIYNNVEEIHPHIEQEIPF